MNNTTTTTRTVVDTKKGITVDFNLRSVEGDQTYAFIGAFLRFNQQTKETEVLLVDYYQAGGITQKRLIAGSSNENETIMQAMERKTKFLSGLKPIAPKFFSQNTSPTSSRDKTRMNEEHTKYGCVVTQWEGELITRKPIGGETGVPEWTPVKKLPVVFKKHYDQLQNALAYVKANLKTEIQYTDL